MAKIVVMGGCGGIGSIAVRTLILTDHFSEVVIAEKRADAARDFADGLRSERLSVVEVDAEDPASLAKAISGADLVLNCVGPFYRFGPPILRAVIEAGIDYVELDTSMPFDKALSEYLVSRRARF